MPRALVIDDSPTMRAYLTRMLTELRWDVACEESAERGAAAALTSPPDLVISDLWMRGLSGLQLCRLLHEEPLTAHVPIVLMSASLDKRARYWALRSGATSVIDKQRLDDLRETLKRLPRAAAAKVAPRGPVAPSEIPTRLSYLLDRSLYQSAVATDLKTLSLAADITELFAGAAQVLSTIADYHWLALYVERGSSSSICVHCHPSRRALDVQRALGALGHRELKRAPWVIADQRCQEGSGTSSHGEVYPIELAGVELGRLAVGSDARADAGDQELLRLVASELASPLRAVVLTEETRRLAMTDALTGLDNRRCASDWLDRSFASAARYGTELSVALLDIDFFKRVNDGYGHEAGDQALKLVAQILTSKARACDVVARWGGEEFLHVMPSTGAAGARIAAERLRMAIASQPLTLESGVRVPLTASFGVATRGPTDTRSRLLERADQALYRAKERGRNRVEIG